MPYRRIERDDGSTYTAWEPGATGDAGGPGHGQTASGQPGARYTYGENGELIVAPPEAPTPPESESVINERIRAQSGGVNGCITFGCLFTLMALAICICGALYFLPIL